MESGHPIAARTETYFRHTYDGDHDEMRRLSEQAKRDQGNASRDIAWSCPEPADGGLVADDLVDIHGTEYWERLSERDRVELNRRTAAWRLTLLVHRARRRASPTRRGSRSPPRASSRRAPRSSKGRSGSPPGTPAVPRTMPSSST